MLVHQMMTFIDILKIRLIFNQIWISNLQFCPRNYHASFSTSLWYSKEYDTKTLESQHHTRDVKVTSSDFRIERIYAWISGNQRRLSNWCQAIRSGCKGPKSLFIIWVILEMTEWHSIINARLHYIRCSICNRHSNHTWNHPKLNDMEITGIFSSYF